MGYSDRLERFTKWHVQLWAESLGKQDAEGRHVGPTPVAALGATDQHSQVQLFMEGPIDKTVTFIAEAASGRFLPATPWGVFVVLYVGLVISLAAYMLWNRCVAALGATVTGVSYHLLSVFTPLMAYAALGERLAVYHGVGIALILAGVALSSVGTANRASS